MTMIDELTQKIQTALPDARIIVHNPTEAACSLEATVISASFEGKTRLQQHRLVYAALGDSFDNDLHALKLTTKTA